MDTVLADVAAPARARLVTRPLLIRFVSLIGTATSFYLLRSVVLAGPSRCTPGRPGRAPGSPG